MAVPCSVDLAAEAKNIKCSKQQELATQGRASCSEERPIRTDKWAIVEGYRANSKGGLSDLLGAACSSCWPAWALAAGSQEKDSSLPNDHPRPAPQHNES